MDQVTSIDYTYTIVLLILLVIIIIFVIIKNKNIIIDPTGIINTTNTTNTSNDKNEIDPLTQERPKSQTAVGFAEVDKTKPVDIDKAAEKGVESVLIDMAKDPKFYGVVAADIALGYIVTLVFDKVFRKTVYKGIQNFGIEAGAFATRILANIGAKTATKLGTKVGSSLATKGAVAASTGPAAPFVSVGLIATEVLSLALDITDMAIPGGTVGYAKMGTNEVYYAIRDETIKQLNEALKEHDAPIPLIIGPLDKIDGEAFTDLMTEQITAIMSSNPPDLLVKPMLSALINDLKAGIITEEDTQNEKIIEKYSLLIDQTALTTKAYSRLCLKYNGKYVVNSKGQDSCSFPDQKSCDNSYSWPLNEDIDMYAEFKDGTCNLASSHLRNLCESNKIPYNMEKGSCDITEKYCKTKGADWKFNSKINENDCTINEAQNFFEMLLGTTVTRGLKQIFDPQQYEKCKENEVDDGYFCRTKKCNDGDESQGADQLCYPKCRDNYKGLGPVCWEQTCPEGFVDDGAFCRKPIETITKKSYFAKQEGCPENSNANSFGDCIAKRVDREDGVNGGEGIGLHSDDKPGGKDGCSWNRHIEGILCYRSCPEGYFGRADAGCFANGANSDGVTKKFTERKLYCDPGYTNVAGVCWQSNCDSGFVDTGAFCSKGGEVIAKKSYGRGVGYIPETTTRVKQRIADYSTKDN